MENNEEDWDVQYKSYEKAIADCINELKWLVENNDIITMGTMFDNPIYPNNEELKQDFTDEHGFDQEGFISFLIDRSECLELDYDNDYDEPIIKFTKSIEL